VIHKILGVLGNRDEKYRFSDVCGVVWCGVERFSVSLWTVLVRKVRVLVFLFFWLGNLGSLAGPRSEGRTLGSAIQHLTVMILCIVILFCLVFKKMNKVKRKRKRTKKYLNRWNLWNRLTTIMIQILFWTASKFVTD